MTALMPQKSLTNTNTNTDSGEARPSMPRPAGPVTWARVDSGFYVGSRAGEFVGTIDVMPDGSHVAFDGRSTAVGRYASLSEAQRAVSDIARGVVWAKPRRSTHVAWSLATVSGVVAAGMLVSAGALAVF